MRFYSFIKRPGNSIYLFFVFLGCTVTIGQFFFNRGFWFDEVLLGLNLINLNFQGLLEPLDFNQAAPIGYLLIQKIIINVFGTSEYSFRILSLLGMLVSVPLLYKSVCRLSSSRLIGLLLCSMLCLNFPFVFYANEAKQYALDVLQTSVLLYFTVFIDVNRKKDLLKYALLGAISVWMSNVAFVSLLVFGSHYLYKSRKTLNYRIVLPIVFWIISFMTYYLLFVNGHPTKEFMLAHWERFFLTRNLLDLNTWISKKYIIKDVLYFTFSVKYNWQYYVHSFILLLGLGYLVHVRKWRILLLLVFPIMVHVILAMLQLYPLYQRFIIDTLPFIYGIYSYGLYFVWKALKSVRTPIREVIVSIPILTCCFWFTNLPIQREEVRDTFQFVDNVATETDEFYFFKDVTHIYSFYSPRLNSFNELNVTSIGSVTQLSKVLRKGEQLNHDAWIFVASWHQPMDKVNLNKYVKLNAEVKDSAGGGNSIAYKIKLKDKTDQWLRSALNREIAKGLEYLDSFCSDQDFIAIHYDFDIPITAKFWNQYPNITRVNPLLINSNSQVWNAQKKMQLLNLNYWTLFKNKEFSSKYIDKLSQLGEKTEVVNISEDVTLVRKFN